MGSGVRTMSSLATMKTPPPFATISSIHSMDLPIIVRWENLGIIDISFEVGFGADYDIGISGEDLLGKYFPLGLQSLAVQHQDL